MTKKRVPRYKNHVIASINAAKMSIEMFNRVEGSHSYQAAIIFNVQAWELLGKGILLRKHENIYYKDGTTINAEKVINKMRFELKIINKLEGENIQQLISLRNEAIHNILPEIDAEIIVQLMYFSLVSFNKILKTNFKTYYPNFKRNFLAISFDNFTFYSHKVSNLFKYSKKYNTKENKILYLLDRGIKYANSKKLGRMINYDAWKKEIKEKPRKSRIARHLSIYNHLKNIGDIRFIPVVVDKGYHPEVILKKSNNPLSPVLIEKSDPNKDYPHLTSQLAEKLEKNTSFVSLMCKNLDIKNNPSYCTKFKVCRSNDGVPKYNDRALNYLIDYLKKNPGYSPYNK